MRTLLSAGFVLAIANTALAADPTDLPPNLRGDLGLGYSGSFSQAGLEEQDAVYGIRNVQRHDLALTGAFTVYTGVAVTLGLPVTLKQSITYPSAREMLIDPVSGSGEYVHGAAKDPTPTVNSKGLDGVWIGLALSPFREDFSHSLPLTARFDVALRTPSTSLYSSKRGVGSGGLGWKIGGAFSVVRGKADPYVSLSWTGEAKHKVDVVTLDDVDRGELSLKDPSHFDGVAGAELIALDKPTSGAKLAFDLHLATRYDTWGSRASGFWLPDTLESSKSIAVTASEHVSVGGGFAIKADFNKLVGLRMGVDGAWSTPQRIEHPYDVYTDTQSFSVGWNVGLVGRFRGKDDRK